MVAMRSKNSRRVRQRARRSKRVTVVTSTRSIDQKAMNYRRLLIDPCNGPLTGPTVAGPTSGLFVRQRYVIKLTNTAGRIPVSTGPPATGPTTDSGTPPTGFSAVLRPAMGTLTLSVRGSNGTANIPLTENLETGILTSARAYRAVAGCMKFVPTGAIGSRSGVVSLGYVPDEITTLGSATAAVANVYDSNLFRMGQRTVGNGTSTDPLEVRWIPSGPEDLEFRSKDVVYNADCGGVFIVGQNLDNNATAGVDGAINGYLDITIVWEWIPQYDSGIVSTVQSGSTSTLQQVLATMGDLGRTVTDHAYAMALAYAKGKMAQMAGSTMSYLAGPVENFRPGRPLLMAG